MAYNITIQNYIVGNVGQFTATSVNVVARPFDITDTTITVDCFLLNADGSQIPEPYGKFTPDPIAWALNEARNPTLVNRVTAAVLSYPTPDMVIR